MAGTRTLRTRKVSRRTPKATTKPISVRKVSGRLPSTEKVPARTMPALVMTAAGDGEGAQDALFGAVLDRLLTGTGDQEDVVVDPQGDEEDEGEERQRGVGPREAEDDVEDEVADAEGGEEAEDHRADQDQRRDDRAQQPDQDQEDHDEHDRWNHDRVAPAASRTSTSTALGPPTSVSGDAVVRRLADRFDQVEGLGRVGIGFQRRLDQDAGRPFGDGPGDRLDAVDPATALRTRLTSSGF